nr:HDOD domain-containing protein [Sporosarcina limicola]
MSFINFTGELLEQEIIYNLDPNRIVIEILENVEITTSFIARLRKLKRHGFKLALDDFILQDQYKVHSSLFKLIDFIKVDFLNTTFSERKQIKEFTDDYPCITLLAEKIETEEQFRQAKKNGYKLFQGYFFAKPEIIKGTEIPPNVNVYFHIIEQLNVKTPNITEIAGLIMRDMSLSYKLLRYINIHGVGIPKKISSIKQALIIIGLRETRQWLNVLALQELGSGKTNDRIKVLIEYSLIRAKMCELLAQRSGKENAAEYFLAGMFSLMDNILNWSWEDILPLISLSNKVASTLTGEKTEITPYLQLTKAVERFDWECVEHLAKEVGIDYAELSGYSQEANRWAQSLE